MAHIFDIAIIGAGFSGASLCYALKDSGKNIVIFDQKEIAGGASGNPRAHMIPYITAPVFPGHNFYNEGFAFSAAIFQELANSGLLPSFHQSPALQFSINDRPARILERLNEGVVHSQIASIDSEELHSLLPLSKFHLAQSDIEELAPTIGKYHRTFSLNPRELCRTLIGNIPNKISENSPVHAVAFQKDSNIFELRNAGDIILAKTVVITAGHESITFADVSIKPLRGQLVTGVPKESLASISVPLCYNGYYLPPTENAPLALLGTTYDRGNLSSEVDEEKNHEMLSRLKTLPIFQQVKSVNIGFDFSESRVSFRAVTKDRLPFIGEISSGLYINAGHGSRGLHSAPLGSQLIADMILKNSLSENQLRYQKLLDPIR